MLAFIGKPNVGKSTLFQAITSVPVKRSAIAFTTIEPNQGVGFVSFDCVCKELGLTCQPRTGFCLNYKRFAPVKLLDVAGLVPGAHQGKGMGNAFLNDAMRADALIIVVDGSGRTDEQGEPTDYYDPLNDVKFIRQELKQWLKSIVRKHWRKVLRSPEALFEVLTGLNIKRDVVAQALSVVNEDVRQWGDEELDVFVEQVLARGKPMIVAFNKVDVPEGWERFKRVHCSLPLFPVSAELELLLKNAAQHNFIRYTPGEAGFEVVKPQLTDQQLRALEFAKQKLEVLGTTGVQQLLNSVVFDVLKMKAVYPVATKQFTDTKGNVLPDVLLLEPRATVKDLAHNIHSSIAKNLVKAVELRSGRVIGANHILQHRDVVQLLFKH